MDVFALAAQDMNLNVTGWRHGEAAKSDFAIRPIDYQHTMAETHTYHRD